MQQAHAAKRHTRCSKLPALRKLEHGRWLAASDRAKKIIIAHDVIPARPLADKLSEVILLPWKPVVARLAAGAVYLQRQRRGCRRPALVCAQSYRARADATKSKAKPADGTEQQMRTATT